MAGARRSGVSAGAPGCLGRAGLCPPSPLRPCIQPLHRVAARARPRAPLAWRCYSCRDAGGDAVTAQPPRPRGQARACMTAAAAAQHLGVTSAHHPCSTKVYPEMDLRWRPRQSGCSWVRVGGGFMGAAAPVQREAAPVGAQVHARPGRHPHQRQPQQLGQVLPPQQLRRTSRRSQASSLPARRFAATSTAWAGPLGRAGERTTRRLAKHRPANLNTSVQTL
jgi:hypothetical protein